MPRCQRTFLRFGNHADKRDMESGRDAVWRCPHCSDAEIYETVTDADLIDYARFALAECTRDFGAPNDASRQHFLLLGLRPECVLELAERRYDIYLQRGSDAFQLRLQIGHEMCHRVCSQGRTFHWIHEMFACLHSVSLLRQIGCAEYADQVDARYRREALYVPLAAMAATNLLAGSGNTGGGPGTGFYGRAYVTGSDLADAIGHWPLNPLARTVRRDGTPDVPRWLNSLDPDNKAISERILGITTDTPK